MKMIKLIDVDELFDNYISDYVYANIGKVKPEEIENKMPVMYEEFGNKPLKELDGKTPKEYYLSFSAEELIDCLKAHLEEGVAVSDFLCEALRDKGEKQVAEELKKEHGEELSSYLMNILSDINSPLAIYAYMEMVLFGENENLRELATELLYAFADKVLDRIVEHYPLASASVKECLVDIVSHASKNDRAFAILEDAFKSNPDKISLHSAYFAKYGDEKALPLLYETIEKEDISYAEFEELRFAIESLGGEYDKKRDFSKDKTAKKIKGVKNTPIVK